MASMQKSHNTTLKMVAEAAHCSTAVVSTVLNASRGNTKVSAKTRERILRVAEELDYCPNYASRSLKAKCSQTLGIYVQPKPWRQLANDYEMSIFKGIESAARELGYDILVLNISAECLPDICKKRLKAGRIDGVLLLHCEPNESWIDALLDVSPNVVAFDVNRSHPRLNRIDFDNKEALFLAVNTLKGRGFRKIGFAGSCLEIPSHDARIREREFLEAVRTFGLPDHYLFHRENSTVTVTEEETYCQTEGREAIRYFHSLSDPPDAVITYNALVGVSLVQEAKQLGISIPEDLSVITIDSPNFSEYLTPQLTAIDHPLSAMGDTGTRELIRLIRGEITEQPFVRIMKPVLVEGGSVTDNNNRGRS